MQKPVRSFVIDGINVGLEGGAGKNNLKYPLFDIAKLNDSCYNTLEVYSESEISP